MLTRLHTYRKDIMGRIAGMLVLALVSMPFTGKAQTFINTSTSGICSNYATDGPTPNYAFVNTFSIEETSAGDFGNTAGFFSITVTLNAPTGWVFDPSGGVGVVPMGGGDLFNTASVPSFTPTSLTFVVTGIGNTGFDRIAVNALLVRPTSTSSVSGDMTIGSVSGTMVGITGGEVVSSLMIATPTPGNATAPMTGVSATTICAGDNVDFSATAVGGFGPTFQWQVNGSNITGATSASYSTTALADDDDVTVIVYDHSCIDNPTATSTAITDIEVKPLPSTITGVTVFCSDGGTTLASAPASGTWSSSFTTVATINASTGVVDAVEPGNATISYQGPNGCYTAVDVTVNPLPSSIDGEMDACAGNSETLSNDDAGGTWVSSNTAVATIGTGGTVTAVMGGTTTITYTLSTGCKRTGIFTVNALPAAFTVTGTGAYCAGGAGLAVGLNNTAIGHTYDLYNGSTHVGTATGSGSAATFGTYTAATIYTATATNDATGCMSNMTGDATLTITPLSTPSVTISYTEDTVCAGTSVTFTAMPANGGSTPTYTWAVNGTSMGTGSSYNYAPANNDVVSVVLTTNVTCPSTPTANDDFAMVVYSNETPVVTINASNTSICQYTPVTFSVATSAHGGATPVYTWYKGGVSTGITGSSYTYQPADNDVISTRLISNYRCPITNNVASNNISLNVDSVYVPVVTITTNTGLELNAGENVVFTAHVTKAGTATPRYQWYVNSTAINGATSATYTNNNIKNNDSVSCWVRAAGVCSDATPTFNSVRMKYAGATIVNTTLEGAEVNLTPNPNNGIFQVKGTLNTDMDTEVLLEVTNMMGQVVYTNNHTARNGNIDMQVQPNSAMSNGMYLLTLHAGVERKTFRFVVAQ